MSSSTLKNIAVIIILLIVNSNSQSASNTIRIGAGWFSESERSFTTDADALDIEMVLIASLSNSEYNGVSIHRMPPPISIEYFRQISKRIDLGIVGIYDYNQLGYVLTNNNGSSEDVEYNDHNISLSPLMRYIYSKSNVTTKYGYASFGGLLKLETINSDKETESKSSYKLSYQISPLCFDYRIYGGLGSYFELGYGNKGIVNVGLFQRF